MRRTLVIVAAMLTISALAAAAADAKALYQKDCAKCHGTDGKGQTVMGKKLGAKDYTSAKVQGELKDETAFKAIKEGYQKGGKSVMKPFQNLPDADIKALVAYMRQFKK